MLAEDFQTITEKKKNRLKWWDSNYLIYGFEIVKTYFDRKYNRQSTFRKREYT